MNSFDRYLVNIDKIFNEYGYGCQLNKLVEEIGELLIAISKKNEKNIAEEMADVEVLIDQFKRIEIGWIDFDEIKFQKAQRQVDRIKAENEQRN